jgi:hypothetical protein
MALSDKRTIYSETSKSGVAAGFNQSNLIKERLNLAKTQKTSITSMVAKASTIPFEVLLV